MRYNDHRAAKRLTQFVTGFDKICHAAGIRSTGKPTYHSDMTTNPNKVSLGTYFAEILATVIGSSVMRSETRLNRNVITIRCRRKQRHPTGKSR